MRSFDVKLYHIMRLGIIIKFVFKDKITFIEKISININFKSNMNFREKPLWPITIYIPKIYVLTRIKTY